MNCARLRLNAETTTIFVRDGWLVIEVAETDSLREQLAGATGDRLVTVAEVSERTGFTTGAVRDWIKRSILRRRAKSVRSIACARQSLAKLLGGKTPETLCHFKAQSGRRRKAVAV